MTTRKAVLSRNSTVVAHMVVTLRGRNLWHIEIIRAIKVTQGVGSRTVGPIDGVLLGSVPVHS